VELNRKLTNKEAEKKAKEPENSTNMDNYYSMDDVS